MIENTLATPVGYRSYGLKAALLLSSLCIALYASAVMPVGAQTKAKPPEAKPAPVAKPVSKASAPASPPADVILIAKARRAESDDRYNLACDYLAQAIVANPKNADAHYLLALLKGRQNSYDVSIDQAKRCLALRPGYAPAHSVLGRALAGKRNLPAAAAALGEAVRLDPTNATSYSNLAAVKGMQGEYQKSADLYRQALKFAPTNLTAHLGLASALGKLNDKAGQIEACRNAVKAAPKSSVAHGRLGYALTQNGDTAGGVSEVVKSNFLRVQESWNDFLGMFLTAWASVFLAFAAIFAVLFAGSRFKPQEGEVVLKSFFLTFYKDKPGRFVVTDTRLVFVPESFSAWFGATRVSIQRPQIESINYLSTVGGGTVSILTRDKSVHQFRMPLLVLDPVRSLLVSQGLTAPDPLEAAAAASAATSEPTNAATKIDAPADEEKKVEIKADEKIEAENATEEVKDDSEKN